MKLKFLLPVTLCLLASHTNFAQDVQPPPNVEELYALLKAESKEVTVPPNPPVTILFFDINHDGIPEALAALCLDHSAGGCHGNSWSIYRFENGEWQWVPTRDSEDPFDINHGIYARGDDFYSLTEEGQKPKLILIYECGGSTNENPPFDYRHSQEAHEITIDDEGYLKNIPIPELTTNIFCKIDWDKEAIEINWSPPEKYSKLIPLPIVTLYSPKQGEPLSAILGQREAYERLAAEMAKGGTKPTNEKTGIESKTNHLWLYAGILLGICVAFYLVRRKTSN